MVFSVVSDFRGFPARDIDQLRLGNTSSYFDTIFFVSPEGASTTYVCLLLIDTIPCFDSNFHGSLIVVKNPYYSRESGKPTCQTVFSF